ncbi:GTPase [Methylomonas sp. AM2-LC]|uniref:GTPase n=1 Tax=Methylomonas sp. AM2-LC TaxID=3153301 RepID=UPI003264BE9B
MLEFIQLIKQRYQTVLLQLDQKHPQFFEYQQRCEQLLYAEAFIRKGLLIEAYSHFPLQIAVVGPTQAGKSSLVNLLLNAHSADVSPLAGYTVHPHGYCHGVSSDDCDGMQNYFGRFQCLEESMLSRNRFDCYSLANAPNFSNSLPNCVVWDTPDFDSIDAADYREGVIRTLALADLLVLVVSKEKYADQSVWEVIKTIADFQQPLLICVNKLNEGNETEIVNSLKQKWQQHRTDPVPEIIPLLFQKLTGNPDWPDTICPKAFRLAKKIGHRQHLIHQQNWLQRYWQTWLEPIVAEHQAQRHWQTLVDQCLAQAQQAYLRDYLDHPHHYDTFQTAILNMLNLLEIPGIAKAISKTRRLMTWPVRTLINLGKNNFNGLQGQEMLVLNVIGEHVMIQLADKLLEKNETEAQPSAWWKDTAIILRQKKPAILHDYALAVTDYHQHFQQNVEAAAQRLFLKLQDQPVILNSLRTTRATTDVAAILLALQTGGIGLHDLVLTPVLLSVSSLLAESAIGSYMHRVEAELKQQQLSKVKTQLFVNCLQQRLYQLPQLSHNNNRFNIYESQCHQAEQLLKEKKHGLRLL